MSTRGAGNAVRIDRIGPMDLTILATDRGSVPMNIGAILRFDSGGGPSLDTVHTLLSERVPTVSRLRQLLRRVPFGCGSPIWVDDADFRLDRHLIEREWPAPSGKRELLDIAAELVCQRQPSTHRWLVVSVPVSGRHSTTTNRLGNDTGGPAHRCADTRG